MTVQGTGNKYQIVAPRVDLKKESGSLPVFFWIGSTEDEEEATMELQESKIDGWLTISYFKPKCELKPGQQLLYCKPSQNEEPKRKKAKKG